MKPHLFFDIHQGYIILGTILTEFGNNEEADALGSIRSTFRSGKEQVDDVFRHVMVTGGNELLGALDQIMSFRLQDRSGDDVSDRTTGMRLCETHGPGPGPIKHVFAIFFFLLVRTEIHNQIGGTGSQGIADAKGLICSKLNFFGGHSNQFRKPHSTEIGRHIHRQPASFSHLSPCFGKSLRGFDRSVFDLTAFPVSTLIDRIKDLFRKGAGFIDCH